MLWAQTTNTHVYPISCGSCSPRVKSCICCDARALCEKTQGMCKLAARRMRDTQPEWQRLIMHMHRCARHGYPRAVGNNRTSAWEATRPTGKANTLASVSSNVTRATSSERMAATTIAHIRREAARSHGACLSLSLPTLMLSPHPHRSIHLRWLHREPGLQRRVPPTACYARGAPLLRSADSSCARIGVPFSCRAYTPPAPSRSIYWTTPPTS